MPRGRATDSLSAMHAPLCHLPSIQSVSAVSTFELCCAPYQYVGGIPALFPRCILVSMESARPYLEIVDTVTGYGTCAAAAANVHFTLVVTRAGAAAGAFVNDVMRGP